MADSETRRVERDGRWELGVSRGVMLGREGVPPAGDTKRSGLDRWLGWRKHRGSPARQVDSWWNY